MIKKAVLLIIFCFCVHYTYAQTDKGFWIINPQISAFELNGTDNNLSEKDHFKLGVSFKGGNFIAENLAFLVGVGFQIDKQAEYKNNSLDLSTGLRYYLFRHVILGTELAYQKKWLHDYLPDESSYTRKPNYLLFGAEVGYAIFLSRNIALEPCVYWKYSFVDRYNQYGLKLGFSIFFK